MKCFKYYNKRGQVWVETVIYTLIGLSIMGVLLAVTKPKIEQMKDKILIEQTIASLNEISSKIYDAQSAIGNKRILTLKITKGNFYIDPEKNRLGWILDSSYKYSQLDKEVNMGGMVVSTRGGNPYLVEIYMDYITNITVDGKKDYVSYDGTPRPYSLIIENIGSVSSSNSNIDLKVN